MTAAIFAHHDKIAATPRGAWLICAEPTTGQLIVVVGPEDFGALEVKPTSPSP